MQNNITIFVNGEKMEISRLKSLQELLAELEIDPNKVAIEKDLSIIHRQNLAKTFLEQNCSIEIVHFIGGG
jgi:thiamine biosynthesis protein ThiS